MTRDFLLFLAQWFGQDHETETLIRQCLDLPHFRNDAEHWKHLTRRHWTVAVRAMLREYIQRVEEAATLAKNAEAAAKAKEKAQPLAPSTGGAGYVN